MSAATTSGSPKSDPRILRSKRKVLQTATDLLLDSGPREFSIEAIALRSGVSKMTIYRHWENREALLLETFRHLVPTRSHPNYEQGATPLDTLKNAIVAYGDEFANAEWSAVMPSLLLQAKQDPLVSEVWWSFAESRAEDLRGLVTDCVDSGFIEPLDTDLAIAQLMGPLSFRRFLSFEPIDKHFCEQIVDHFIRANSQRG